MIRLFRSNVTWKASENDRLSVPLCRRRKLNLKRNKEDEQREDGGKKEAKGLGKRYETYGRNERIEGRTDTERAAKRAKASIVRCLALSGFVQCNRYWCNDTIPLSKMYIDEDVRARTTRTCARARSHVYTRQAHTDVYIYLYI